MRKTFLDPQLQARFESEGFVKVPFLDQEAIQQLLDFYHQMDPGAAKNAFHATMHIDDPAYRKAVDLGIKRIIGPATQAVLDRYQPLFSNFLVKEGGQQNEVPLHQDWNYCDENQFVSVNIWIPLVDTGPENGGLYVLPGSQRLKTPIRYTPYEVPAHEYLRETLHAMGHPIETRAGEAVIYNSSLLHFSKANFSPDLRVAVAYVNLPEEAEPLHYFHDQTDPHHLHIYQVDVRFFWENPLYHKPEGFEFVGKIPFDPSTFAEEDLENLMVHHSLTSAHLKSNL
ncbi:MAG: phytanoyl-CoA dioxygenase family protein [Bacteroidia bacterium]|nr:phytanoyl-CoA dioxygenase family protein [Bacteroidia bacterium]